jgi:DNA-directed RNA polymerase alpha subunit/DNA-directed RNA polymerase subunit L
MNPTLSEISEERDIYRFTLSGVNVSVANAIRRIILSEIPVVCFRTETEDVNKCIITKNTTRLHNEILKQRLSCIPVHMRELELLPDKYILELDEKNETDNTIYVTSESFKIRSKTNGKYLTAEETRGIFPADPMTNHFIDFVRLRPRISDSIPGEEIQLTADFSVATAMINNMFNVVSICAYANTTDAVKITSALEQLQSKGESEGKSHEEIEFDKRNFKLLDAFRLFKPDSFDFIIQTIGIYENAEIVKMACSIFQRKMLEMIQNLEADIIIISRSESTMKYSYDVILENEDYTIGKVLEHILYENYYKGDKILSYCGFKKFHPHNQESTIRLAFHDKLDKGTAKRILRQACVDAQEIFVSIYKMF